MPIFLQNYQLKYRCEDCIYNYFNYKYVYGFDATRANVTVSTGSRYQVYIQVSTRYGMGRSSAATVHVPSTLGRVLQLHAMVDEHNGSLVSLTWLPPRSGHPEVRLFTFTLSGNAKWEDFTVPFLPKRQNMLILRLKEMPDSVATVTLFWRKMCCEKSMMGT